MTTKDELRALVETLDEEGALEALAHVRRLLSEPETTPPGERVAAGLRSMTVREAGRLGGEALLSKRGQAFFTEVGKKGGAAVLAQRGTSFFAEIGRKGGATVKERFNRDHFVAIGRQGGEALKAKRGADFFSAIGRKGGRGRGAGRQARQEQPNDGSPALTAPDRSPDES